MEMTAPTGPAVIQRTLLNPRGGPNQMIKSGPDRVDKPTGLRSRRLFAPAWFAMPAFSKPTDASSPCGGTATIDRVSPTWPASCVGSSDGRTSDIEALGVDRWLRVLARYLKEGTYRPRAVRQVLIPKKQRGKFLRSHASRILRGCRTRCSAIPGSSAVNRSSSLPTPRRSNTVRLEPVCRTWAWALPDSRATAIRSSSPELRAANRDRSAGVLAAVKWSHKASEQQYRDTIK